jgi:hypothetical protein
VRSLKKLLEKIYRKSALTLVKRGGPGVPPDTLSGSNPVVAADSSAAQVADGAAAGSVLGTVTAASDSGAESSRSAAAAGQAAPGSSDSDPASSSEGDADAAASSAPVASSDSQQPDGQLPATSPQVNKPCTGLAAHCSKA